MADVPSPTLLSFPQPLMDSLAITLDPGTCMLTAAGECFPLASLKRLWSVVAVFPGVPDETEHRWVVQAGDGIVLAPALSLPTGEHVQALSDWSREREGLCRLELAGWPWRFHTAGWAWKAMRRGSGRFSLAVWDAVRRDGRASGPLELADVLRDE